MVGEGERVRQEGEAREIASSIDDIALITKDEGEERTGESGEEELDEDVGKDGEGCGEFMSRNLSNLTTGAMPSVREAKRAIKRGGIEQVLRWVGEVRDDSRSRDHASL